MSKISIDKAESLIESAQRGCFYCTMIRSSLEAAQPGWESEKAFIYVYLAPGLPVIVRLQFGATSTVKLGREAMLGLGIDLPEGQAMDFIITVGDPTKEAIDVEIYRPHLTVGQTTVGGMSFTK